jgi:hypothetical protein
LTGVNLPHNKLMSKPTPQDLAKAVDLTQYIIDPVFQEILTRLLTLKPGISVMEHMLAMKDVGRTRAEGITFWVKDYMKFRMAIAFAKNNTGQLAFHWDNRKVWIYELAAVSTDGQGYRQIGSPSLHCAVGDTLCNVHVDEFGFVERGPNGEYFTPNLGRHIGDELFWRAKVRPLLLQGLRKMPHYLAEPASKLLDHTNLILPSMDDRYGLDINDRWRPRVGMGVKGKLNDRVDVGFEFTCGNVNCHDHSFFLRFSIDIDPPK